MEKRIYFCAICFGLLTKELSNFFVTFFNRTNMFCFIFSLLVCSRFIVYFICKNNHIFTIWLRLTLPRIDLSSFIFGLLVENLARRKNKRKSNRWESVEIKPTFCRSFFECITANTLFNFFTNKC